MTLKPYIILFLIFLWLSIAGQAQGFAPNFLILLTDDQRLDTITAYGSDSPIETPNIDRLAAEGILFTNAFVTTPVCVVSRASILTGLYARNHHVRDFRKVMDQEVWEQSYPVLLKDKGYFLGQIGKFGVATNDQIVETFDFFDAQIGQGPAFREHEENMLHDAEWLTLRTIDFLNSRPTDRPFALQVNYKEPHPSSVPAPEDDNLLNDVLFMDKQNATDEAVASLPTVVQNGYGRYIYDLFIQGGGDKQAVLRDYYEKVVSVDRSIGKILSQLEQRGLLEETIILFLSDNGTHLGEKRLGGKWTAYDHSLRIPFMIRVPRPIVENRGVSRDELVLNIDIAPTILALAGIDQYPEMDGTSLIPLFEPDAHTWRTFFFFEHMYSNETLPRPIPSHVGVRTQHMKYIRWIASPSMEEEFFNLEQDPEENQNLINRSEFNPEISKLKSLLEKWDTTNPDEDGAQSIGG